MLPHLWYSPAYANGKCIDTLTCNMSRIDNATLQLTLTNQAVTGGRSCKVRVYAVNYNVLRRMCEEKSIKTKSASVGYTSQRNIPCCGKSLKVLLPLDARHQGPRLITVPKGKNVEHWVIRRWCLIYTIPETERVWVVNIVFPVTSLIGGVMGNLGSPLEIQSASLRKQERYCDYVGHGWS
jgi:hypothetical protein